MRGQLAPQAQELLGQGAWVILTERVDEVALRIGQMVTMDLPALLDRHLPRPWPQRGLSWGGTAVMWLAYLLTEGDPRTVSVDTDLQGMHHPLSDLTAQGVAPLDCSDDRFSHLLHHVSKKAYGHQSEGALNARSMEGHAWPQDLIRCEAPTGSGDPQVPAGGLGPFGHRKDDPTRPQIKVRRGSLAPLGRPLATEVVSGDRADDGLDLPSIERRRSGLPQPGLRLVGDGKRSALATRASLARPQDGSLAPFP